MSIRSAKIENFSNKPNFSLFKFRECRQFGKKSYLCTTVVFMYNLATNSNKRETFMKYFSFCILGALLLASCATNRRAAYLQEARADQPVPIEQDYQIRIKPLDRLTVTVNSKNPELAAPFNAASSYNSLSNNPNYTSTTSALQILTVDKEGRIQLPIIGEVDCSGLTRDELAKKIEEDIRAKKMVNDPIVVVQFADVKFSVLGEVARPGQFSITKDRISLFDALAMAGDLTIFGQRDNVALIREENGQRTIHYFDLKDPQILASPYFYLQQDDVIYVTPNKYKAQSGEINQNRSFYLSIISTVVSVATLIVTITKIK